MKRQQVTVPADVQAILGDARTRAQRRVMTGKQKRQADRDALRQRVTLELDPRVVEMIRQVARAEGCSPAGVVNLLALEGLRQYAEGTVEFYGNKRASEGHRYAWVIVPEGVEAVQQNLDEMTEDMSGTLINAVCKGGV